MPVILTYLALACLTAIAVILRLLWPRMGPRRRRQLMLVLAILLAPALLSLLSRWDTTLPRLNACLFWIRLFACELCVVFFTLVRPRLLTGIIAAILTLPLFSSSAVGPASGLFTPGHPSFHPVGGGYFVELFPWSSGPGRNSGSDLSLFYQPAGFHLLRRPFLGLRLYNTQCRTRDTTATIDPHTAHIAVHCPALTTDPAAPPSGTELDCLIPRGARSPALAGTLHR